MMSTHADFLIVGTGPAGVSAAFPLAQAGLQVLIVDGDWGAPPPAPAGRYLDLRFQDEDQSKWMLGDDFYGLRHLGSTSPKTRVPRHRFLFDGFAAANKIVGENFTFLGALASGGLSNAWGCGVARFDASELQEFPIDPADLDEAYASVCRRIGVSGGANDALHEFFGVDAWASPPAAADRKSDTLLARGEARRDALAALGVRVGRSRVAVLANDHGGRLTCDGSGLCLWGCRRGALYSASYDLDQLKLFPTVRYRPAVVVESIVKNGEEWIAQGVERESGKAIAITAQTLILAAGTLATTRLVLQSLGLYDKPLRLLSSPSAAFLMFLPEHFGRAAVQESGFTQVSFALDGVASQGTIFGWMFSTTNLPASEFIRYIPTSRAAALSLWRSFMPATLVGNCFLPGALSDHVVHLDAEGRLRIRGGAHPDLDGVYRRLSHSLRRMARQLGAVILPGSVITGALGSDFHYAGTLPMRTRPVVGELDAYGEVHGLPGLHVVDGAALPSLPAKPHTLTIMANATRIGRRLASAPKRRRTNEVILR